MTPGSKDSAATDPSIAAPEANAVRAPEVAELAPAVDAVRRLVTHLRKTTADPALLNRIAAEANALADSLAPFDYPGPYGQSRLVPELEQLPFSSKSPSEFFRYSPVVGPLNPIAPPVAFRFENEEMVAEHVFDAPYCGPPTAVHGGIIALVFDELLGSLGVAREVGGFTGQLQINYRSLTPIGQLIKMRGWVARGEGRKTWIKGTFHAGDQLCAEAEGLFIRPKESMMAQAMKQAAEREAKG